MAERDFNQEIAALNATLKSIESVLDVPRLLNQKDELEEKAGTPDLWNDPENAQKITSALSRVQSIINRVTSLRSRISDLPIMLELAVNENDASAKTEVEKELDSLTSAISELEVQTLLSGEYDHRDALITIRSEAGGVDAADWAEMVSRMYFRYCERHDYNVNVLETSYAEEAGIKSTTFRVTVHTLMEPFQLNREHIVWFESPRLIVRIVATRRLLELKLYRWSIKATISILMRKIYVSMCIDLQGRVVKVLTPQIQPFASPTFQPGLLSHVRTNDLRYRIVRLRWLSCNQNYLKKETKKSEQKLMHSAEILVVHGEIRFAPTCSIRIKW